MYVCVFGMGGSVSLEVIEGFGLTRRDDKLQ